MIKTCNKIISSETDLKILKKSMETVKKLNWNKNSTSNKNRRKNMKQKDAA